VSLFKKIVTPFSKPDQRWSMILGIIGLMATLPGAVARIGHTLFTLVWGRKKIKGVVFDSSTEEPLESCLCFSYRPQHKPRSSKSVY
jgi:hypothetical protein